MMNAYQPISISTFQDRLYQFKIYQGPHPSPPLVYAIQTWLIKGPHQGISTAARFAVSIAPHLSGCCGGRDQQGLRTAYREREPAESDK